MESAKLMWSRISSVEDDNEVEQIDVSKKHSITVVENLDYQVIENYAYGQQQVVYFPRVVKVADAVSMLKSNHHNGFPVIEHARSGETLVIGLMLRSHLLVLLQSKVDFQHSPVASDMRRGSLPIRHNFSEFVKPVSSKGISIHDIHLSPDDLEMYIDLAPYVNPSPYVVPEDMSLTKVYNLFRQLGLRHICVAPRTSRVIGLITRKDLLIEDNEDPATVELQSTSSSATA